MDMNLSKFQKIVENIGTWHAAVHGVAKTDTTQRLNNNKQQTQSNWCYRKSFKWRSGKVAFCLILELCNVNQNTQNLKWTWSQACFSIKVIYLPSLFPLYTLKILQAYGRAKFPPCMNRFLFFSILLRHS